MNHQDTVILGAGVAGLAAANYLHKKTHPNVLFEKEDTYGGLCRRLSIEGFTFDRFVHFSFTDDKEVRELQENSAGDWSSHKPISSNYYKGHWLSHPAQNNLYPLPKKEKDKILNDFKNRPSTQPIDNYQDWLDASYGLTFSRNFPSAYTRKYWTTEPENLETSWVGNRVLKSDLEEIVEGANNPKQTSKFYTKEMRYPKKGGFQSFFDKLSDDLHINYNKKVVEADTINNKLRFSDGSVHHYETLLSTLPLPTLIKASIHAPPKVKEAAKKLVATGGVTISIGLTGSLKKENLWFYVYDEDIPFARVYSPSLKSPNNAPENCSSLQAEIYFSSYKPLTETFESLTEQTIHHLCKMDVISKEQVLFAKPHLHKFANVLFDHNYHQCRSIVQHWLKEQNIFTAGRFGEWAYLWSGQSMRSGIDTAKRIISN